MVCKGNVVEVVLAVVRVEGSPTAVGTLKALNPLAPSFDGLDIVASDRRIFVRAVEGHDDDGRVVEVGIVCVVVLECPPARPNAAPFFFPVSLDVEYLATLKPIESLRNAKLRLAIAGLQQRVTSERGVPDGRNAGLAIGFIILDDHQAVDQPACDSAT